MVPWNAARTKVQLRLSIQRLRTLQEKRLALAKKSRREIADLLLKGRVETARLRVEGLIQDDIYVELLELLELYSEKLQARFGLLEVSTTEPEASIEDAVCAIVYAAPRTELKELQVLREMMMHKFGRTWSLSLQPSTPPPASVPPRVLSKLALYTPERELVDAYLWEIAKGYGVDWQPDGPIPPIGDVAEGKNEDKETDRGAGDAGGGGGGSEGQTKSGSSVSDNTKSSESGTKDESTNQTIPHPKPSMSTSTSAGQAAATAPDYPVGQEKDAWATSATTRTGNGNGNGDNSQGSSAVGGRKLTEDEELARRFEKLKNLR